MSMCTVLYIKSFPDMKRVVLVTVSEAKLIEEETVEMVKTMKENCEQTVFMILLKQG